MKCQILTKTSHKATNECLLNGFNQKCPGDQISSLKVCAVTSQQEPVELSTLLKSTNITPFAVYTDCITTLQCTVLIYYIDMFHYTITDVFNHCSTVQYCVFAFIMYRIFVIYIALYSEMMTSDQYCTELQCGIVRYIGCPEVSHTADCYQLYRSSRIHYVKVYLNFL